MSDTSSSGDKPSDTNISQALRHAVQSVYKSGNLENLTVKRIRKSTEIALDLQDDFFKTDAKWKDKSKEIIQAEVDAYHEPENGSSQPTPKELYWPPSPSEKNRQKSRGTKRASDDVAEPKKRRKKDESYSEECTNEKEAPRTKSLGQRRVNKSSSPPSISHTLAEGDREDGAAVESHRGLNGAATGLSESEMSEVIDEVPKSKRRKKTAKATKRSGSSREPETKQAEQSESEMSELIDEAPKSKRGRKSGSMEPKVKAVKSAKGKKPTEEPANPDSEEVKKLQGWLVKCGIRKMWFKELAPYDTSKAKIRHLKEMLADAGMTGRYSEAKAEQIKDGRELKADLEAVREGEKLWGQKIVEEDPSTGRPERRLARGLQGLDFLNDDDGEETD